RNILHLAGSAVIARYLASVDEIGMERIGRDVAILLNADRMPIAKGDLPMRTPADDGGRPALLLPAIDPIGKLVVRADVIELSGGLIVPGAPCLPTVDRDRGPLV